MTDTPDIIRVELGREIGGHGIFDYTVSRYGLQGRSSQPLLDACFQIQRMGGPPTALAGLFRGDRCEAMCGVAWGAAHTVSEPRKKGRIKFAKRRGQQ